jgi:hypothetical protein
MGFTTVLAVMAALYLAAGLLFRVNGSPQEASATARI